MLWGGYVSIAFLIFALIFTSCKDFMNAGETQKQIEAAIAYANAPSYTIKVENSKNHGNIVKPAAGETSKKVTDVFEIKFEAYSDYEFIKWEVKSSKLPEGESIYDYISFEDEKASETKVTFLKALEEIVITPVTAERAHIISYSPMTTGVIKNSTIVVLFDQDMDEDSIYYTTDEITELKKEHSLKDEDFLPEGAVIGQTKIYGYTKNGETFYKNVTLVNNKSGKNIAHKFDSPSFENSRTLVITTKDKINGIDDFTQVLVTIEKGMFYKQDDKPIEMGGIKRWMYQVSTKKDNEPLGFQKDDEDILFNFELNQTEITGEPSMPEVKDLNYPKFTNDKITFSLDTKLQDVTGGTGPTSNFYLYYERVKESDYKTAGSGSDKTDSFSFDYDNFTSDEAMFNGDLEIELPKDGVYRFWFDFPDRSNNHFYWPTGSGAENSTKGFYISKDETKISKPSSVKISSDKSTTYKLEWTEPGAADYKEAIISTGQTALDPIAKGTKTTNLTNITSDNSYTVTVVFKDYAGNESEPYVVPRFLTGVECTGTPVCDIPKVFAKDKTYKDYGLTLTVRYSDKTYRIASSSKISTVIKTSSGPITFKEDSIIKDVGLGNDFYVGASDLKLTQTPEKMPDGYTGTVASSSEKYYKFGDYPQTLAENQDSSNYGSDPAYNGWYLSNDGYFYAKKDNKYYKVEPIIWRVLNSSEFKKRYGNGNTVLFSEKILFEYQWYSVYNSDSSYENSSIRTYLINKFFPTAFNITAQNKILKVEVDNSKYSTYVYNNNERLSNSGRDGSNTNDKIFLLSAKDASDYYCFDDVDIDTATRKHYGTAYAYNNNATETKQWWLRTPTIYPKWAVYVDTNGQIADDNDEDAYLYEDLQTVKKGIVPAICVATTDLPE